MKFLIEMPAGAGPKWIMKGVRVTTQNLAFTMLKPNARQFATRIDAVIFLKGYLENHLPGRPHLRSLKVVPATEN